MIEMLFCDFCVLLPLSLWCWTGLVELRRVLPKPDQPNYYRVFAAIYGDKDPERDFGRWTVRWTSAGLVFGLAVVNFVPLALLAVGYWGLPGVTMQLAYFGIQGLWLLGVRRAIGRGRWERL